MPGMSPPYAPSVAFVPSLPLSLSSCASPTLRPPQRRPAHHAPPRRRVRAPTLCSDAPSKPEAPDAGNDSFRSLRKVLAALASVGVCETVYLSVAKVFASPAAICATRGCVDVLSGPYSTFLGVPLSAFGAAAYAAFAALAAWPLGAAERVVVVDDDGRTELRSAADDYRVKDAATRPLLLGLSSVMVVFSGYFMFLLAVVIRDTCPYCIFSAALSASLFVLTAFVGRAVRDARAALNVGGGAMGVSAAAAYAVFVLSSPGGLLAAMPDEPQAPPVVTERSDARSLDVARKLRRRGARMYGAYWCSHCYDQKQRFGARAFARIEYVECDKGGVNTQAPLCREKRIPGYPTWEVDGVLYPGELQMDDLEKLANGVPLGGGGDDAAK